MQKEKNKTIQEKNYLSSPTMHGEELKYMTEAYKTNQMSMVGENINEFERLATEQRVLNMQQHYVIVHLHYIYVLNLLGNAYMVNHK